MLLSDRKALAALRDDYLERAAAHPRESFQRVMIILCEQIERVMAGEGNDADRYSVQQRLNAFMPDNNVRLY